MEAATWNEAAVDYGREGLLYLPANVIIAFSRTSTRRSSTVILSRFDQSLYI